MRIKIKKYAFTIAEAIIIFIVIGAIFVLTVSNINITPSNDYNKLYWQAFNTILQASMSYEKEWESESINLCSECSDDEMDFGNCYRAACWRNSNVRGCGENCKRQERNFGSGFCGNNYGGTKNIDRDFPGFLYNHSLSNALIGRGQDREFCEKFVSKINTHPAGRCESFITTINPYNLQEGENAKGVNFLKAFAFSGLSTKAASSKDGTIEVSKDCSIQNNDLSPSFIALNGQKFYISTVLTANTPKRLGSAWETFGHQSRESYRFIVVDLNGDSKPNSQFKKGFRNPDIVLFAINSMGQVIPLGLPEFSQSYINAVVYYPNDLDENGSRIYPKIKSDPMPLYKAKQHAFGNDASGHGLPYGTGVSSAEPLSQSAKFYAVATKCAKNPIDCASRDAEEDSLYADALLTHLVMQFIYKEEGSSELFSYLTETGRSNIDAAEGCTVINSEKDIPACAIDILH